MKCASSLLGLLIAISANLNAQWIRTNGPPGGIIECLAAHGTALFAATLDSGVYRSTDSGAGWIRATSGLGNAPMSCFAAMGSRLYAGHSGGMGVWVTTNDGVSWTDASGDIYNKWVNCLVVKDTLLFAGTSAGGIQRTTDYGASWTLVNTGLTDNWVYSLAAKGSYLFAGTRGQVFRSSDNGAHWISTSVGITGDVVTCFVVSGSNLFAGTSDGVFLSTNNGTSWSDVSTGLPASGVLSLAVGVSNLFVGIGSAGGVWRSSNNGANWTDISAGLTTPNITSLLATPDGMGGTNIFAGTYGGGVLLTTNNGASWVWTSRGLPPISIVSLAIDDDGASNIAVFAAGNGLYRSTDDGTSWELANTNILPSVIYALTNVGSDLYAGTGTGNVYRSEDQGANWTNVSSGLPTRAVMFLTFQVTTTGDTNLLASLSGSGVYISSDRGSTWNSSNTGLTNLQVIWLAASPSESHESYLVAGTTSGGVYFSTDEGANWTRRGLAPTSDVKSVVFGGDGNGRFAIFAGTAGNGVYRSSNYGVSWVPASAGLPNPNVECLASYPLGIGGTCLFAGTQGHGVFLSTDLGVHWTPTGSGMYVQVLARSSTDLFAGASGTGVWRKSFSEIVDFTLMVDLSVRSKWNMLSIPLEVADYRTSSLFPSATSSAFAYESSYLPKDTLTNRIGYWLKFSEIETVSFSGLPVLQDTISVTEGWNMIGSISAPVSVSQITSQPGGIITSQFFGYKGVYMHADTIQPGQAYWVKVSQEGDLIISYFTRSIEPSDRIRIVPINGQPPWPPEMSRFESSAPSTYVLEQNYPNPFNPSTVICYALPVGGHVTLKLFNVLGEEVALLVDGVQQAGYRSVEFDGSSLASGVYICRLTAAEYSASIKVTLLR